MYSVTIPWIPEHVSELPVHHIRAEIGCSTPCSLDILLAYPEHEKKNPRTRGSKSWQSTSFQEEGKLGVCVHVCFQRSHHYCADEGVIFFPTNKAIRTLGFDVHPSKWGPCTDASGKAASSMNTQHQHKENHCSAMRADFCHQCFNQVTSEDICLMALAVSQVCGRYSIKICRTLCHCSVHFPHFIFIYIILISVKLLLSVYDACCILRKKITNCNFKTKDREQTGR